MSIDAISPALQQHYAAQNAVERRHAQAEASLSDADIQAVTVDRLNDEESLLLRIIQIFRYENRSLTEAECLAYGRELSDLIDTAIEDLREEKLGTGWYVEEV